MFVFSLGLFYFSLFGLVFKLFTMYEIQMLVLVPCLFWGFSFFGGFFCCFFGGWFVVVFVS